jgi:hypothetical protein
MFDREREAFGLLRKSLGTHPKLRSELEKALAKLLADYSTSIRENRFVVGGAVEVFVCAALRACGVDARDGALSGVGADIHLQDGAFLSVKGCFSPKVSSIRLLNVLGTSKQASWRHATIFLISERGIAYADPDLLPNAMERKSDAVVLASRKLRTFLDANPQWVASVNIPFALDDRSQSRLTSRTVAFEIMRGLPTLRGSMPMYEE